MEHSSDVFWSAVAVIGVIVIFVAWLRAHFKATVLGIAVLSLKWWARWWTNLATQSEVFLQGWREYREAHPIGQRSDAVEVHEVPLRQESNERVGA